MSGSYPDAEDVVTGLLSEFGYACTFLPDKSEWEERVPIIAVNRVGGGSDGITDRPLIQVGVLADTRTKAWAVAGECRDKILAAGNTRVGSVLIDATRESQGVQQFPDLNPDNRFVASTYQFEFRRTFA